MGFARAECHRCPTAGPAPSRWSGRYEIDTLMPDAGGAVYEAAGPQVRQATDGVGSRGPDLCVTVLISVASPYWCGVRGVS